jgi:catechol 2,3-dioxygenase
MITPFGATASSTSTSSLPDATDLGAITISVGDLERSLAFYRDVIGFSVIERGAEGARLGVEGETLLILEAIPGAPPAPGRATGLYHFAILTPSRLDLARSLYRLAETGYPLGGASDHLVSEALYLSDPDGNGIEIYRDRPRADWPLVNGTIQMDTKRLDLNALIDEAAANPKPWSGLAPGTTIGHIHLKVGDIDTARTFYHDLLGFDIVVDYTRMGAIFLSAGGYHHHIGANVWESRGGSHRPAGTAGLERFTVRLPKREDLALVRERLTAGGVAVSETDEGLLVEDPWQNRILLTSA